MGCSQITAEFWSLAKEENLVDRPRMWLLGSLCSAIHAIKTKGKKTNSPKPQSSPIFSKCSVGTDHIAATESTGFFFKISPPEYKALKDL